MTRVWSMAREPSHTEEDIAQIQDAIIYYPYYCGDAPRPSRPAPISPPPVDSGMTSSSPQSSPNNAQDMRTPLLPFPLSLITWNSGLIPTSDQTNRAIEDQESAPSQPSPLPDVVNVELRVRSGNGHTHARRAVSVSLPLDSETIRSVGVSLRRISEEFEESTSRTMLSDSRPSSDGIFSNMLASIGLSRRRPRCRNGRQRSFSTNDATQQ